MSLFGTQVEARYAPRIAASLGVITKIHPNKREVDIIDVYEGFDLSRVRIVGPELPPVRNEEDGVSKKKRDQPTILYWRIGGDEFMQPYGIYIHSFDIDDRDVDQAYRVHWRIGGVRVTMDKNGQTVQVEQSKSDGSAGPTVTLNGSQVIIGDTATAKDVARKGDLGKLTIPTGTVINGAINVGGGTVTLSAPLVVNDSVEITGGSDKLKIED